MGASGRYWDSPVFKQSGVVSAIFANEFGRGMTNGIVSAMMTSMLTEEDFRINMKIAPWLGLIALIGAMVTLPVASYLMAKIGRRVTYIVMSIPIVIGLVMTACSYNVVMLLLGRFLCGITFGCSEVLALMITGEYTSPQYRGIFLILRISFFNLGILLGHILGYFIHWRVVSFVVAATFIISIIITFTWPESPYWLAEHDRLKESEETLYWLRGRNPESTKEFDEIVKNQQNKRTKKTFFEEIGELFMKLKKKNFWKPFVIIALTSIMMECGGKDVFPLYTYNILSDLHFNPHVYIYFNVAIISIITVTSFISAYLVKVFKLRPLLFTTGFVAVVNLYLTSLVLYLASNGTITKEYSWISLALLGLFFVVVNLACTLVPMTIAGEIFSPEHRAVGAAVFGYFITITMVVTFRISSHLLMNFQTYGTFTFFASGLLLCLLGLYIMLPETKDKTLYEIEEFFIHGAGGHGWKKKVPQRDQNDEESQTIIKNKPQ